MVNVERTDFFPTCLYRFKHEFKKNELEKIVRHIDNIHHSHGQEYGFPQASVLLFLNDDFKGGDFIISDITYKTKKGSAIVFPSNFMFPHEVKLVEKGTRYSIVTWLM